MLSTPQVFLSNVFPQEMIVIPLRFVLICRLHAPRSTISFGSFVFPPPSASPLISSCQVDVPPLVMYKPPSVDEPPFSVSTYRTPSSHQETRCCPASRCSGVMRGETENENYWRFGTLPPPTTIVATTSRVIDGAAAG